MDTSPDHEPFPGFAEDLQRHRERAARLKRAWAAPLPGPLREAFCHPWSATAAGRLRPVTLGDLMVLTRWESPLIAALTAKMAGEEGAGGGFTVRLSDHDVAMAALLWTLPHARAWALLEESPAEFGRRAMARLARWPGEEREALAEMLLRHLLGAFRTSVALHAPAGEGAERVFQYGEASDGFGWWLYLLGTMMRDFGMTREYALGELPLAQAFALQAWSQYSAGHGLELASEGYIAQEAERQAPRKEQSYGR